MSGWHYKGWPGGCDCRNCRRDRAIAKAVWLVRERVFPAAVGIAIGVMLAYTAFRLIVFATTGR